MDPDESADAAEDYALKVDFMAGGITSDAGGYSYTRVTQRSEYVAGLAKPCRCGVEAFSTTHLGDPTTPGTYYTIRCDHRNCPYGNCEVRHERYLGAVQQWNDIQSLIPTPLDISDEDVRDAGTMRMLREVAAEMGYGDVLEALEDLERLKAKEAREKDRLALTEQQQVEQDYQQIIRRALELQAEKAQAEADLAQSAAEHRRFYEERF